MPAPLTRREAVAGLGGLVASAIWGCGTTRSPDRLEREPGAREEGNVNGMTARTPAAYLPHGGGPWPFVDLGVPDGAYEELETYLRTVAAVPPEVPRAVLVVSAHWEQARPTVMTSRRPPMLYDYYGFPPESYELTWPAPGAPEVAAEVRELLREVGVESGEDPERGFDHGTFVVTKLAYPEPRIPTFQLSLVADLDPARHFALGRALAPLRDRGVYIIGSGMSYHDMRGFGRLMRGDPGPREHARRFDDWLAETVMLEPSARETRLVEWASAPSARACHPREEHLLPLHVIAGTASEDDAPSLPFRGDVLGAACLAAHFG